MAEIYPLQILVASLAGWMNRQQVLEYLVKENWVLEEQFDGRLPRLNDDQRRRLATKGRILARRALQPGGDHRHARHHPALASPPDR